MLEAAKTPVTAPHGKNHGKREFPLETGNLSHHLKKIVEKESKNQVWMKTVGK